MLPLLLGFLGVLSGCAGAHLYNKQNHETAQTAQTKFEEVNLGETLQGERARMTEILERELQVVRKHMLNTRDAELINIIGGTDKKSSWGVLEKGINTRIVTLAQQDAEKINLTLLKIEEKEHQLSQQEESIKLLVKGLTNKPKVTLSCTPGKIITEPPHEGLTGLYEVYIKTCETLLEEQKKLQEFGGKIGELVKTINNVEINLVKLKDDIKNKTNAYQSALSTFKAAKSKAPSDKVEESTNKTAKNNTQTDMVEELSRKLNMLGSVSDAGHALENLGFKNFPLMSKIVKLEEQRELVNTLLKDFVDDNAPAPKSEWVAGADPARENFVGTLNVINKQLTTDLHYPKLSVLTLQNERLRLEIEGLKRRVSNDVARLALMKKQKASLLLELNSLTKSQAVIQEDPHLSSYCREMALNKAFEDKLECREAIARVLLLYARSWSVGQVQQQEIDFMLTGLRHSAVLDHSEIALAQWENLIAVPVNQLVALHGSGITQEQLTRLGHAILNAAGLFFIGSQIN